MDELLRSALELTALGMGMTFLSIGALTLGMYAMTALFRGKDRVGAPEPERDTESGDELSAYREGDVTDRDTDGAEDRRRAAAAAVAVALAMTEARSAVREQPGACVPVENAWNTFARSLHLSRRVHYDARRSRG